MQDSQQAPPPFHTSLARMYYHGNLMVGVPTGSSVNYWPSPSDRGQRIFYWPGCIIMPANWRNGKTLATSDSANNVISGHNHFGCQTNKISEFCLGHHLLFYHMNHFVNIYFLFEPHKMKESKLRCFLLSRQRLWWIFEARRSANKEKEV